MTLKSSAKRVTLVTLAILMIMASLFSYMSSSQKVEASLDPASKLICKFDDGQTLVNFHSTDLFHYMLRSKSAVVSVDDVEANWMNKVLTLSGFDFTKTNTKILGRELEPKELPKESTASANKKAEKVSAFDRFGMAGLKWSSYQGEWKYYHVNACADQESASPTNYGAFYKDRKEPKSTYNEISTSIDNRSVQFDKGVMANLDTAFSDTVSNLLFMITKIIVTLTITFVGLSFTDVISSLGMLGSDGDAGKGVEGIFKSLFDGLFSGFIIITFLLTAIYILYKGLIKREMRFAIGTTVKTIVIFIVAIIISTNPSMWIGIPNKIAGYGQSLVINATSGVYEDKDSGGICETDVGSITDGDKIKISKPDKFESEFERVNSNMRSMVGCKMWETLLFKPWVRGQFGAEYSSLSASKVKNNNSSWVGTPSVPLGGGKKTENWALFQLSSQTNAHAPIGDGIPTLVSGVNGDWWRIVDALSNYQEKDSEESVTNVVKTKPTKFWESWVGNNETERLGVAFLSILFGIFGSIGPLVFAFASIIYGVGITLLMMVSPIFLLMGTWGGKGNSMFLGWLAALANTVIKKIIAGLLLILSLAFSMIIMGMVDDIGFIASFLLMAIVSIVLVKNKNKLLDMAASVNFGGSFDPRMKANQILQSSKVAATGIRKTVMASAVGAAAAHSSGQNVLTGARIGVTRQLENKMYTSKFGREILRQSEISGNSKTLNRQVCSMCHKPLGAKRSEIAYEDDNGNYYCIDCADEVGTEQLYEVLAGQKHQKEEQKSLLEMYKEGKEFEPEADRAKVRSIQSPNSSRTTHGEMRHIMELQKVNGEYVWNDEGVKSEIEHNIGKLNEDYVVFANLQSRIGSEMINPPSPPEPISEYIDLAMINLAWANNDFEVIKKTYKEAWKQWYEDNSSYISNVNQEDLQAFKDEIDSMEFDIDASRAEELVNDFINRDDISMKNEVEREIYTYVNGELIKDVKKMKETDELLSD